MFGGGFLGEVLQLILELAMFIPVVHVNILS